MAKRHEGICDLIDAFEGGDLDLMKRSIGWIETERLARSLPELWERAEA